MSIALAWRRRQPGGALELAHAPCRGSRRPGPPARPAALALRELGAARVERLLAAVQALLEARSASARRCGRLAVVAAAAGAVPSPAGRPRPSSPPGASRSRAAATTRPRATTTPAITISIAVSSPRRRSPRGGASLNHRLSQAAGRASPRPSGGDKQEGGRRPPRQMAAVMRCWVGCAGRARPDAVSDRPQWWFVLAVVTEAAASAGIRGFAGFSRAWRLGLSLVRIVVPAAPRRNRPRASRTRGAPA